MNKRIILGILLVVLALSGGVFLFLVKQQKIEISQIQPVVQNGGSFEEQERYPQHIEAIPGNTDEVWYNIPEIGARMRLNKEFATSLIYQYSRVVTDSKEEWDAVDFSTKELIVIDTDCSPEEGRPLGSITKWEKDLQESAKNNNEYFFSGPNSIQIGDDYYVWTGPQAVCWNPSLESEARKVFPGSYNGADTKYISEGIKTIQSIPSK